jgi:hypothetical protein
MPGKKDRRRGLGRDVGGRDTIDLMRGINVNNIRERRAQRRMTIRRRSSRDLYQSRLLPRIWSGAGSFEIAIQSLVRAAPLGRQPAPGTSPDAAGRLICQRVARIPASGMIFAAKPPMGAASIRTGTLRVEQGAAVLDRDGESDRGVADS